MRGQSLAQRREGWCVCGRSRPPRCSPISANGHPSFRHAVWGVAIPIPPRWSRDLQPAALDTGFCGRWAAAPAAASAETRSPHAVGPLASATAATTAGEWAHARQASERALGVASTNMYCACYIMCALIMPYGAREAAIQPFKARCFYLKTSRTQTRQDDARPILSSNYHAPSRVSVSPQTGVALLVSSWRFAARLTIECRPQSSYPLVA